MPKCSKLPATGHPGDFRQSEHCITSWAFLRMVASAALQLQVRPGIPTFAPAPSTAKMAARFPNLP